MGIFERVEHPTSIFDQLWSLVSVCVTRRGFTLAHDLIHEAPDQIQQLLEAQRLLQQDPAMHPVKDEEPERTIKRLVRFYVVLPGTIRTLLRLEGTFESVKLEEGASGLAGKWALNAYFAEEHQVVPVISEESAVTDDEPFARFMKQWTELLDNLMKQNGMSIDNRAQQAGLAGAGYNSVVPQYAGAGQFVEGAPRPAPTNDSPYPT